MDILDVLKSRLPEELAIASVKDNSYRNKHKIKFHIGDMELEGELQKAVPLGKENAVVDSLIRTTMAAYYAKQGNLEDAEAWLFNKRKLKSKTVKAKKNSEHVVKLDAETEEKLEEYSSYYGISKEEAIIKAIHILLECENE